MSTSLWPCQDGDSLAQMNCGNLGLSTPLVADVNVPGLPASFQCDITSSENLVLELHDYSKSPLGETEVKFQLTRDTLKVMLRSMTYISEQLSAVPTSSRQAIKKQQQ